MQLIRWLNVNKVRKHKSKERNKKGTIRSTSAFCRNISDDLKKCCLYGVSCYRLGMKNCCVGTMEILPCYLCKNYSLVWKNKEINIICRAFYKGRMILFNVCMSPYQSFITQIIGIDRKLGIDHRHELNEEIHGNFPVLWRTKYENLLGLPSFAVEAS